MAMGMTLCPAPPPPPPPPSVDDACPRLFNATLLSLLCHRRPHHHYAHTYAASTSFSFPSSSSSSSSSSSCSSGGSTRRTRRRGRKGSQSMCSSCSTSSKDLEFMEQEQSSSSVDVDCLATGLDVESVAVSPSDSGPKAKALVLVKNDNDVDDDDDDDGKSTIIGMLIDKGVLISPFFFWGTAMVAMKEVLPILGPFSVASFRLIPAGLILVAFAASTGRPFPSGLAAWLSISLFGLIDAACFQGFLAEGLQRTSAGLGSVIIDSQPLTVAMLAALLFDESIGIIRAAGLILGIIGLLLLEVPALVLDGNNFSLWGSGEWWMLLAAQSMAIGTVMVRWVSKYSDPVMATGWHMVIGGLPLVIISIFNHDPGFSGSPVELKASDIISLLYTSIFGSAISYGVYFYSATKGSLTTLSSLTFLTPMFASLFGFLYLGETFSPLQLVGAIVTVAAIYLVNSGSSTQ